MEVEKMNKSGKAALLVAILLVGVLAASLVMAKHSSKGTTTKAKPQCSDGIDNDGDGLVDYPADPGCSSKRDKDEFNPVVNATKV
jgi:hypothetical protein